MRAVRILVEGEAPRRREDHPPRHGGHGEELMAEERHKDEIRLTALVTGGG